MAEDAQGYALNPSLSALSAQAENYFMHESKSAVS